MSTTLRATAFFWLAWLVIPVAILTASTTLPAPTFPTSQTGTTR